MEQLSLVDFHIHSPRHLTVAQAQAWAEAASVSLLSAGHGLVCELQFTGPITKPTCMLERLEVSSAMEATHADSQDATEDGAYAMVLLAVKHIEQYQFVHKVRGKGPGYDHYLSRSNDPEDIAYARLEVSGILSETKSILASRVSLKRNQISKSGKRDDAERFLVGVAGFSAPQVWIEEVTP